MEVIKNTSLSLQFHQWTFNSAHFIHPQPVGAVTGQAIGEGRGTRARNRLLLGRLGGSVG